MSLPSTEEWRAVVGYEGLYEVSDLGRVRSLDRKVRTSRGQGLATRHGRVLRAKRQPDGRLSVLLYREGRAQTVRLSVLVLLAFVGPRPDGYVGCHNDGDLSNNCVGNLRWDTQSENILDQQRHGTSPSRNRTQCPRGHRLEAPNLIASMARKGFRTCLACDRARGARRWAKRCGKAIDFADVAQMYYVKIMKAGL